MGGERGDVRTIEIVWESDRQYQREIGFVPRNHGSLYPRMSQSDVADIADVQCRCVSRVGMAIPMGLSRADEAGKLLPSGDNGDTPRVDH